MNRAARSREALISISLTQIALSPYLLLCVGLGWGWCLGNVVISALLGPALVAVLAGCADDEAVSAWDANGRWVT
jgi:hypothetical protein